MRGKVQRQLFVVFNGPFRNCELTTFLLTFLGGVLAVLIVLFRIVVIVSFGETTHKTPTLPLRPKCPEQTKLACRTSTNMRDRARTEPIGVEMKRQK